MSYTFFTAALEQSIVNSAIETFERETCLRFKVQTDERDFISVKKTGRGYFQYTNQTLYH